MRERSISGWLFLLVLVLDQAVKTVAVEVLAPGHAVGLIPALGFGLVNAPVAYVAPEHLRLLAVGLLAILVLYRLRDKDSEAGDFAEPATQLIAAGVFSGVVDLLLLRKQVGMLVVTLTHGELYLNVADLAVVAGIVLFVLDFFQRRWAPLAPQVDLREPQPLSVDLDRFTRGIDNIRIDVRLSPHFVKAVGDLVSAMLAPHMWWESWRSSPPAPSRRSLDDFRTGYAQVIESVIHRAKREQNATLAPLLQLAVLKFILTEVRTQFDNLLRDFRRELDCSPPVSSRSVVRMSQHLIALRRRRATIIEDTNRVLLEHVQRVENGPVKELRRSLLGATPGVAEEVLANPVLWAEDPRDDEFLVRHYLLLGHRAGDISNPKRIEHMLLKLVGCRDLEMHEASGSMRRALHRLSPATAANSLARSVRRPVMGRPDSLANEDRYEPCPWLDVPENADILFGVDIYQDELRQALKRQDQAWARRLAAHARFQRRMVRRLDRELWRRKLSPIVIAAYETPALLNSLDGPIGPRSIQRYLSGPQGRAEIAAKLRKLERHGDRALFLRELDAAADRVKHCPTKRRRAYAHRFVRDFLAYRHDLKHARIARSWLEQIRLLEDADDIRLSRANRTLYELLTPADQANGEEPPITGHVIIKADVRGSTGMTNELLQRGLNPASHFDINFFEPIGSLTALYGAEKVFVEGDAVILAILEREGGGRCLSVARACGLARSILEIVAAHNATGVRYGLPKLELGIGVAYEEAPPTYLFDEHRPIMISPAISRADRLSSCAAFLRGEKRLFQAVRSGCRIQVYQAEGEGALYDKKGASAFRYNVDGIELEPTAFRKLASEIHLQSLRAPSPEGRAGERYHRGRYPDVRGVMRNLVVREGKVKRIDRREGRTTPTEQSFYEVVVDAEILKRSEPDSWNPAWDDMNQDRI